MTNPGFRRDVGGEYDPMVWQKKKSSTFCADGRAGEAEGRGHSGKTSRFLNESLHINRVCTKSDLILSSLPGLRGHHHSHIIA